MLGPIATSCRLGGINIAGPNSTVGQIGLVSKAGPNSDVIQMGVYNEVELDSRLLTEDNKKKRGFLFNYHF